MSVTLELPDDIGTRLLADPAQAEPAVRRELAIALYREGKLPPGRAAQLAGMDRWEFEKLLIARQVPMPRTLEDINEELPKAARGSREKFDRVLSKVPDVEPEEYDRLSPNHAD